jgi:short-subunit dehydrogenase
MKTELSGKVVIVTGASSGIGKACAFEFAKQNCKVVLASRNIAELEKITSEIIKIGGEAICIQTDVDKEEDCKNLISRTIETYHHIDILINNAGISMRAMFNDLDLKVMKKVMETNFWGTVYCTKYALPHLLKQKGVVVGVASISALTPLPGRTGYCASKYAFTGFLKTLRLEHFKDGLHVLTVFPGFTTSNIRNNALNHKGDIQIESPRDEAKMMSAEEVARRIAKATIKRKRSIVMTPMGWWLVLLYKYFPGIMDKLIYKQMAREHEAPFK